MHTVGLPRPETKDGLPVEAALGMRRSVRQFAGEPLSLKHVSQLLWSAQGVTDPQGHKTSPSAGALYPLNIYFVARSVRRLPPGSYRYSSDEHELVQVVEGDFGTRLCDASLGQEFVRDCPGVIVISAVYRRTTWKYGKRGERYVYMEVGHVAQNISLQAVSLGLGTVIVGAFQDDQVKTILGLDDEDDPLCLIPVGRPSEG